MEGPRPLESFDPETDFVTAADAEEMISRLFADYEVCENSPELETLFRDESIGTPPFMAIMAEDVDCCGSPGDELESMDWDGDSNQMEDLQLVNGNSERGLVERQQSGATLENWQKVMKVLKFLKAVHHLKPPHPHGIQHHQLQRLHASKEFTVRSPEESLALVGGTDIPKLEFRDHLLAHDELLKFFGQEPRFFGQEPSLETKCDVQAEEGLSFQQQTKCDVQAEDGLSFQQREAQFEAEMDKKAQEQAVRLAAGRDKLSKNKEDIKKAYGTLERKMDRHLPVVDQIFDELEKELSALDDASSSPQKGSQSIAAMKERSLGLIQQGKAAVKDLRAHKATCTNKINKAAGAIEKEELIPAKHFQEYTAVAMAFVKQHVRDMVHHADSQKSHAKSPKKSYGT